MNLSEFKELVSKIIGKEESMPSALLMKQSLKIAIEYSAILL